MKRVAFFAPLFLCLSACGSDDQGTSVGTGISETSGNTQGDGDGDTGAPFEPVPARGVTLTKVTANHGVNVSIADGPNWVDGSGREGRLSSGRDTLFRVYYTLDPDWVERDIEARLTYSVGGQMYEFTTTKTLVVDSSDMYLDGTMWFALPAADGYTATDARFQVSLWETAPGGEGLMEHTNVAPESGLELVGFEDEPMAMNVVFVPFTYNGRTPDYTNDAKMNDIYDEIYQTEPIQTLNTSIDDLRTSGANSDVCNMLQTMNTIWSQAGAPPTTYYVGLVDTGASFGVMGCALINANFNADVWVDNDIHLTATSVVHELGHDQGLQHVQCDDMGNPAADPDPNYPDAPLGRTLNTGFGIRDFKIYPGETTTDYMSYCTKRWVSPWTWNKVWTRIKMFTAMGSPLVVDPVPVLHLGIWANGEPTWWTALDRPDRNREPDAAWVEFVQGGEVVAREIATIDTLTDDVSKWITVPMPNGDADAEFDSVRFVAPDGSVYEGSRDEVSFYNHAELAPQ